MVLRFIDRVLRLLHGADHQRTTDYHWNPGVPASPAHKLGFMLGDGRTLIDSAYLPDGFDMAGGHEGRGREDLACRCLERARGGGSEQAGARGMTEQFSRLLIVVTGVVFAALRFWLHCHDCGAPV